MIWTLINLNFKTFKNIPIMVTSIPPCLKFKGFLNNNFGLKFLKEKKKNHLDYNMFISSTCPPKKCLNWLLAIPV